MCLQCNYQNGLIPVHEWDAVTELNISDCTEVRAVTHLPENLQTVKFSNCPNLCYVAKVKPEIQVSWVGCPKLFRFCTISDILNNEYPCLDYLYNQLDIDDPQVFFDVYELLIKMTIRAGNITNTLGLLEGYMTCDRASPNMIDAIKTCIVSCPENKAREMFEKLMARCYWHEHYDEQFLIEARELYDLDSRNILLPEWDAIRKNSNSDCFDPDNYVFTRGIVCNSLVRKDDEGENPLVIYGISTGENRHTIREILSGDFDWTEKQVNNMMEKVEKFLQSDRYKENGMKDEF